MTLPRSTSPNDAGEVNVSIVTAEPRPIPIDIDLMERHPLGSQIFYPLQDRDWLVLVADDLSRTSHPSAPFAPPAGRA